jgi:hypothetical protein
LAPHVEEPTIEAAYSLGVFTDRQTSHRTNHRITRDVLLCCIRNSPWGETVGTERKVTGNPPWSAL